MKKLALKVVPVLVTVGLIIQLGMVIVSVSLIVNPQ